MIGEVSYVKRPRGDGSGTAVTESYTYGTSAGNDMGKLVSRADPDAVTIRYAYDTLG